MVRVIGQAKWTTERVELLTKLWLAGLSANGIATELNCGFTRNAVIGKVHRIGLPYRYDPIRRGAAQPDEPKTIAIVPTQAKPTKAPDPRPKWIVPYAEKPPIDLRAGQETEPVLPPAKRNRQRKIRLLDLTSHTCRFPIGDPRAKDFHFCGKKPVVGQPYCLAHCQASFYCYGHKGPIKYRQPAKAA